MGQRTSYSPPVPSHPPATSTPVVEPLSPNVTSSQKVQPEDSWEWEEEGLLFTSGLLLLSHCTREALSNHARTDSQNPEVPGTWAGSSCPHPHPCSDLM